MSTLLLDPRLSGRIARLDACLQEALIRFARDEGARSAQPQPLVDRVLEMSVCRLDIAVLVGVAGEVARSAQSIVIDQLPIPLGKVTTAALRQLVRGRREVVSTMLDRNATQAPQRALHA